MSHGGLLVNLVSCLICPPAALLVSPLSSLTGCLELLRGTGGGQIAGEELVQSNVAHVARLGCLGAFHKATYITLLGPISSMKTQGKDNTPNHPVRAMDLSGPGNSSTVTCHVHARGRKMLTLKQLSQEGARFPASQCDTPPGHL